MDTIRDRVANLVAEWSGTHASLFSGPKQVETEAVKSAAWATVCSWPHPALHEYLPSARFLVLFFLLDDASSVEQEDFIRVLRQGDLACTRDHGLVRLYNDLFSNLDVLSSSSVGRRRFEISLIEMSEGMWSERCSDATLVDEEFMFSTRRRSVGVEAYLDSWLVAKKIEFTDRQEAELSMAAELRRLSVDLVILANDLASLEKDLAHSRVEPAAVDPNLVLIRARRTRSIELAVGEVVQMYNECIRAFKEKETRLLESAVPLSELGVEYLQLLKNNIDGNAEGHRRLVAIRYPGAMERLSALSTVY